MTAPLRYLSVCSGIEAASVAWKPLGWESVAYSEIEGFPNAVLGHHYRDVPNLGDMSRYAIWPTLSPDVLVGGTPCQSFSVAGLRKGLADPRGNLALVFLGVVDRFRPRWVLWENVPGVRSADEGQALGAFLGGLGELGYGWAYRSLDAQYFGLAQRRERVFVVAHSGGWAAPSAVLFEPESLRGDSAPSRETGERVAPTIASRPTGGGGLGTDFDCDGGVIMSHDPACTLTAREYKGALPEADLSTVVTHSLRADGFDASEDGTGRGTPLVAFDTTQISSRANRSNPRAGDPCHPLPAGAHPPAIAFSSKDHGADAGVIAPTLRSMGHDGSHANGGGQVAVAFEPRYYTRDNRTGGAPNGVSAPLLSGKKQGDSTQAVVTGLAVRRLTPRECERLQGFPDAVEKAIFRVWREDEKCGNARSAEAGSALQGHDPSAPVDVSVLIDFGDGRVQSHSHGRLLWSANTADRANLSPLRIGLDVFARLAALTTSSLVRATRAGVGASPLSISGSSRPLNGSASVHLCGSGITALAGDADQFTTALKECSRFTTSEVGPSSLDSAPALETLCSFVVSVIASSIPAAILEASSYAVSIETVTPYTLVPYRGKPAADGPRYKALGNSMAVPVIRWLGERIALVESVL